MSTPANSERGLYTRGVPDEEIKFGTFKVYEIEEKKETQQIVAKMYDKMYESLRKYSLEIVYPITLLEFLKEICAELNWDLQTTQFLNSNLEISEDKYSEQDITYREILEQIAEASGTVMYFNSQDRLVLRTLSTEVLDTLTTSELKKLKIEPQWGELNSLVLSRMPQEDNIVEKDDGSIAVYGLFEFKIANNEILDDNREALITPLFGQLTGLKYYPSEGQTIGLGYYEIGDRIKVQDLNANEFETLITDIELEIGEGFKEKLVSNMPTKTSTDYETAGVIGKRIKNTEIIVNKQEGTITFVVSDLEDAIENITLLEQIADGLSLSVSKIGGTNVLKNSSGLRGTLEEWQELDVNGDPTDVRNTATILTEELDLESRSGYKLEDSFITQDVEMMQGENYTFYCRFKKNSVLKLNISGLSQRTVTVDGYANDTWATYKLEFVAQASSLTLELDATGSAVNDYAIVGDMVLKKGVVNGWEQAPNEVYGRNFRFDKEGFKVLSMENDFESLLDNQKFSVKNVLSGVEMIFVSKDSAKISELVGQGHLTVQRYDNPVSALKIMPTDSGCMLVINN